MEHVSKTIKSRYDIKLLSPESNKLYFEHIKKVFQKRAEATRKHGKKKSDEELMKEYKLFQKEYAMRKFTDPHRKKVFETCWTNVARLKEGPSTWTEGYISLADDLPTWVGFHYADWSFSGRESVYWWWAQTFMEMWNAEFDFWTF